jgi:tRNA pseudouridine38-40 synthase
MPIMKLTLEYDGRKFHGWQRQPRLRTVQEELETAIATVAGRACRVTGASRTDAGVHALGQVASFHTTASLPPDAWQRALNSRLPADLVILRAERAPAGFDARGSATGKRYDYLLWRHPTRPALMADRVCHYPYPLKLAAMRAAARRLTGRHDFTGFQNADPRRPAERSAICTLRACRIISRPPGLIFQLDADRFLYKMARTTVGTLIEIGRGRWPARRIDEILASRDRRLAGPPAPACGLYLVRVDYLHS